MAHESDISCGPDRTKQSFIDECDINKIVAQYDRTGLLTHVSNAQPLFVDVSETGTYREALQNVRAVEAHFLELPSKIRARFENDPAQYLDWQATATDEDINDVFGGPVPPPTSTPSPDPTPPAPDVPRTPPTDSDS